MQTILAAVLLAVSLPSCASGPAGYWTNRARDLTDVAHVDLVVFGWGAAVNVGPLMLGAYEQEGLRGYGERYMFGLGGVKVLGHDKSTMLGLGFPFSKVVVRNDVRAGRDNDYISPYPGWGSIGADVGVLFGVGFRVDVVEFCDLIAGFLGADLLRDDVPPEAFEALRPETTEERAAPVPD